MNEKQIDNTNRTKDNLNRIKYEIAQEFGISHRTEREKKKKG